MTDNKVLPERSGLACVGLVASSVFTAVVLARIALAVQAQWAPALVFPILAGALQGAAVVLINRQGFTCARRCVAFAALAAAVTFSAGLHAFAYQQYRENFELKQREHPLAELAGMKPWSFSEFLQYSARQRPFGPWQLHEQMVWCSWVFDAVLVVVAAVGIAYYRMGGRNTLDPRTDPAAHSPVE